MKHEPDKQGFKRFKVELYLRSSFLSVHIGKLLQVKKWPFMKETVWIIYCQGPKPFRLVGEKFSKTRMCPKHEFELLKLNIIWSHDYNVSQESGAACTWEPEVCELRTMKGCMNFSSLTQVLSSRLLSGDQSIKSESLNSRSWKIIVSASEDKGWTRLSS